MRTSAISPDAPPPVHPLNRLTSLLDHPPSLRWPSLVMVATGGISAALGLIVLVGWYTHSVTLVQIVPTFVPMQYNTALEFLICGAGLLATAFGQPRLAAVGGGIAAAVGLLTLIQYLFDVNLGIDQLLMEHSITVETSHPGRMAPFTALCFGLTGAALLLTSLSTRLRRRPLLLGLLGSIVVGLGMVPLFGYLVGLRLPMMGGTRMAVHTAAGFVVLGAGIIAFAWRDSRVEDAGAPRWLPILVGIGVATAAASLWQALRAQEGVYVERMVQLAAASVKGEITAQMGPRILGLIRMAKRWETWGSPDQKQWASDAGVYVSHYPDYYAIEWVDPSFYVRWIVPLGGNEAIRDVYLGFDERQRRALETARDRRVVVATRSFDLAPGAKGFIVYVPIFQGEDFGGLIGGIFRVQELFDVTLSKHHVTPGYAIAVFDGAEEIYSRDAGGRQDQGKWYQEMKIDLYGISWRVLVWPRAEHVAEMRHHTDEMALIGGLLMAVLLTLAVHLGQTARLRTKAAEAANRELENEIAERKQAEEALRESEAQFRELYDQAPVGYHECDAEGRISRVNRTLLNMLGYTAGEMLGRRAWEFILEQETSRQAVAAKLAGTEPLRPYERTWRRKDGTLLPALMHDHRLHDADGRVVALRSVVQDITEGRRA